MVFLVHLCLKRDLEVYAPEISCVKETSVHIKNMSKVQDFAMALRARKVSGAFEKRTPGL